MNHCKTCPLSLRCLSGMLSEDALFCSECESWWCIEEELIVCCDGFPNAVRTREAYSSWCQAHPQMHLRKNPGRAEMLSTAMLVGALANQVRWCGVESCPRCDNTLNETLHTRGMVVTTLGPSAMGPQTHQVKNTKDGPMIVEGFFYEKGEEEL